MIALFKKDLHNKIFSLQDQVKKDENDTLQKRIKFWFNVIDMERPIPNNAYDHAYHDGMDFFSWCRAIS